MSSVFTRTLLCTVFTTTSLGALAAGQAPVKPAASTVASEQSRSMDVLRAFNTLCNAPQLTFDALSAHAKAIGMKPAASAQASTPAAGKREGRWGGAVPSGPFALLLDENRSMKGVTTSCAVAAAVGDADIFRAEAIKSMKLRDGVKPDTGTDGRRTFDFGIVRPPSTRITVYDFKPKGVNQVMVSVSSVAPGR